MQVVRGLPFILERSTYFDKEMLNHLSVLILSFLQWKLWYDSLGII